MLILTFQAAGDVYAIDVLRIVEVVPRVDLRALPHAPSYLSGLFDYRGTVVPVVDLGVLLGSRPCHDRLSTRIILVDETPGDRQAGPAPAAGAEDEPGAGPETEGLATGPGSVRGLRKKLLGVVAEQVSDVASVGPDQVLSAPLRLAQAPYLGAMIRVDDRMVQQIAVERILDESMRAALFGEEGPPHPGPRPREAAATSGTG